jgi:hypothetical protein
LWPIERLVEYPRNPRKNDGAVDRMCSSIREFGFKIPCLVRSDGEVVDGHLRLKAARKLGIIEIPVILCDEWTAAQVTAFLLMVNRSVTWADWDEELLALELQEIQESDFDLSLTGFDPGEIDNLLALDDDEKANATPPLPKSPVSQHGDLWLLGPHRVLCGDATSAEAVARLLGERKPRLMVTDPPYGIELDSEWRDRAGLNGHGAAEPSYMKKRTQGTTKRAFQAISRRLVGSLLAGAESRGRLRLARIEIHARGPRWAATHRLPAPPADHLEQGPNGAHTHALLVSARTLLVRQKKERAVARQSRRELDDLGFGIAEVHHGRFGRRQVRSSNTEASGPDAPPDPKPLAARGTGV